MEVDGSELSSLRAFRWVLRMELVKPQRLEAVGDSRWNNFKTLQRVWRFGGLLYGLGGGFVFIGF